MLILASQSPRRQELIRLLGLPFAVCPADVEETLEQGCTPEEAVLSLSRQKALAVSETAAAGDIILGADTVVTLDGVILGKPGNEADAAAMLRRLSGRSHTVYTGITLCGEGKTVSAAAATTVGFRSLSDGQIQRYIATGEPMDKAGAYGIQGFGAKLVEKIEGDYFNVVGLPVCLLSQMLEREFGIVTL